MDCRKAARELLEQGATVIPLLSQEELKQDHEAFKKAIYTELPEYKPRKWGERVTFDPSGKLGGSSSHHREVRRLRHKARLAHKAITQEMLQTKEGPWFVTCIPDAAMMRRSCDKVQGNWHRDNYAEDGYVFGGWLNLDGVEETKPQYFTFGAGSHKGHDGLFKKGNQPGFQKLTEGGIAALHLLKLCIYPGEMLVFLENVAHTISNNALGRKTPYMLRLFTACRVSKDPSPLPEEVAMVEALKTKANLAIKGGSPVPLVARHGRFRNSWKAKAAAVRWIRENLTDTLQQAVLDNLDGEAPCLILDQNKFPDYNSSELSLYKPLPLYNRNPRKRWASGVLK
jgi:hypothetical protein